MKSNVMARDAAIIKQNDEIYGSNRMTYRPISIGLAGNTKSYDSGKFEEKTHTTVNYDVAQKFPQEAMAEALKATQTELKQVHAVSSEFQYAQYASGLEFSISNMTGVDPLNIRAGITNNMSKEWDAAAWFGDGLNNYGYVGHPLANIATVPEALTFDSLVVRMQERLGNIKGISDVTSDDLARVRLVYDSEIAALLDKYEAGSNQTNREKLEKLFPGMPMEEAAKILLSGGKFIMVLSEVVTLHHASLPGLYATEPGKYKMSESSLFTYESTSVELEIAGAIQEVTFGG